MAPPDGTEIPPRIHHRRASHIDLAELEKFQKGLRDLRPSSATRSPARRAPRLIVRAPRAPSADPRPTGRSSSIVAEDDVEPSNMASNGNAMGSYMDNSPNPGNMARQTPSPSPPPSPQHGVGQVNGGGAMAGMVSGVPMNAGHQMDLNHLYEMVIELSDVLKNNREMTRGIIASAEDIMRRANSEGASPSLQQVNGEITAARIAELERALAKERRLVEVLKREQVENTKLIGEFETAMGIMVEQIRNYCQNINVQFLGQKRHYNNLLQAERDAHLESRLDRDAWHAKTMRCAEMIRTALRLRTDEEQLPTRIISGLQNEVRAYRNALGMDPEKPEEEFGWEYLKDLPPSVD